MTLNDWIAGQPRGALSNLAKRSGVGWVTLWRATKGRRVSYATARAISAGTGGAVSIESLCEGHAPEHATAEKRAAGAARARRTTARPSTRRKAAA